MGFLFSSSNRAAKRGARKHALPAEYLNKMACSACPRNTDRLLKHAKMKPTGSKEPVLYVLGEAPGKEEDRVGRQFKGDRGRFLREHLANSMLDRYETRWNNTIRCKPVREQAPSSNEIECCRNFQVEDIEKTKPKIVIAVGVTALQWAVPGASKGIMAWRGRLVPAKIGKHVCWVFPIIDPTVILNSPETDARKAQAQEVVFRTDLMYLKEFLKEHGELLPCVQTDYYGGITCYTKGDESDASKVIAVLKRAESVDYIGIDLETVGLRPYWPTSRLLTASISFARETHAFPLLFKGAWKTKKLYERVWQAFVAFLHARKPKKVAHNAKFEQEWLGFFGSKGIVKTRWRCTQAQAYILDSRQGMLDLDTNVRLTCGFWLKPLSNIDTTRLESYPLEKVLMYNALDAKWVLRVYWAQQAHLLERKHHVELARERCETATTLVFAQLRGLLFDRPAFDALIKEFTEKKRRAEKRAQALPSWQKFFKLQKRWPDVSGKDDMELLFTRIRPCKQLMTEKGKISTSEDLLVDLSPKKWPEAKAILDLREPEKVLSTYLLPLPEKVAPDGYIHTNFNPYQTDTERLSAEDPNVQNFPKRENKHVRGVIKAG